MIEGFKIFSNHLYKIKKKNFVFITKFIINKKIIKNFEKKKLESYSRSVLLNRISF